MLGLNSPKAALQSGARVIYHQCKQHAYSRAFYTDGLVGSEFRPVQTLIAAHVWAVHRRLLAEGEDGRTVQEALFDHLWEDTTHRIRAAGIPELSVNKHLGEVQQYSFSACVSLDQALDAGDEDDIVEAAASALWSYVYLRREDVDEERVVSLARYLLGEQRSVGDMERSALLQGRFAFDAPSFPDLQRRAPGQVPEEALLEEGDWRVAVASTGRRYLWSAATGDVRWADGDPHV